MVARSTFSVQHIATEGAKRRPYQGLQIRQDPPGAAEAVSSLEETGVETRTTAASETLRAAARGAKSVVVKDSYSRSPMTLGYAAAKRKALGASMGASGSDLTFGVLAPFSIWHWTCRWVTAPSIVKLTQLLTVNFKIQTSRRIGTDLLDTKRLWLKDKPINATHDPPLTIKSRPLKSSRRSTGIDFS
jgi:hypothetical protein